MHTPHRDFDEPLRVAALYCFTPLAECGLLRAPLERLCREQGIRGTLLLAKEGINGTIAGTPEGVARVLEHIRTLPNCANLDIKLSHASTMPFYRMKVRVKREIVTMGEPGIDPLGSAGTYVEPEEWNALISDPDTIVIDTRNDYEVAVGTFEGAIDPGTTASATSRIGFVANASGFWELANRRRSRCFVRAASDVKSRLLFSSRKGLRTYSTSRAAS